MKVQNEFASKKLIFACKREIGFSDLLKAEKKKEIGVKIWI